MKRCLTFKYYKAIPEISTERYLEREFRPSLLWTRNVRSYTEIWPTLACFIVTYVTRYNSREHNYDIMTTSHFHSDPITFLGLRQGKGSMQPTHWRPRLWRKTVVTPCLNRQTSQPARWYGTVESDIENIYILLFYILFFRPSCHSQNCCMRHLHGGDSLRLLIAFV